MGFVQWVEYCYECMIECEDGGKVCWCGIVELYVYLGN